MKSLPYVKIEYSEAIDSKRELLSSQADTLNIFKTIQNYKKLRKKELSKKIKLKTLTGQLNKKIKKLLLELPETQTKPDLTDSKTSIKEITKRKSINQELAEIQRKLEELNRTN